jgi:hypothetical protein
MKQPIQLGMVGDGNPDTEVPRFQLKFLGVIRDRRQNQ